MEIGLMTLGDLLPNPATGVAVSETSRHRSFVDQAVLAEELGFTSVHLGEHHFSDYVLSAPPVVLAAIGERTSTLKLSTAVTLAGNLDPVRVAEDYATVDVLHDGRVELVLGRGSLFAHTYAGFGHATETARERYDEAVPLLVQLLREENVTWHGEFRAPLNDHTTRPRPASPIPVWIGAASRESAELAADLGCALMLPSVFGKPEMFAPVAEIYRARWEKNGSDPADATVGACCHIHVGATSQEAKASWEPHYRTYWEFVGGLLGQGATWPDFEYDTLLAGPAICGSPQAVAERVAEWDEILDLDRQLFMFDLGGIESAAVRTSMELFGTEVIPKIS